MQDSQEPVRPVEPVAPWLGGKSRLADTIISWINTIDHVTYAEPFVGMGGVFLRRNRRPKAEVINDYSRDVSNLFRILQRHYIPFVEMLRWRLTTRDDWEQLNKTPPETMTDLERAARFLYMLKTSFGGKATGQSFGVDTHSSGRFDVTEVVPALEALHARLRGVTIECLNFPDFIARYDRPHVLFYLDPPYYGCENDYGKNLFSRADFEVLAQLLAAIKGTFILSLNDHPDVRRIFAAFKLREVVTQYSIRKEGAPQDAAELLIHNLPKEPDKLQEDLF
ncbi:MAG: DNA adenine methylase [Alphaproteobacteria bacterium]